MTQSWWFDSISIMFYLELPRWILPANLSISSIAQISVQSNNPLNTPHKSTVFIRVSKILIGCQKALTQFTNSWGLTQHWRGHTDIKYYFALAESGGQPNVSAGQRPSFVFAWYAVTGECELTSETTAPWVRWPWWAGNMKDGSMILNVVWDGDEEARRGVNKQQRVRLWLPSSSVSRKR